MIRFFNRVAFACVLICGLPGVARVETRGPHDEANIRFRWAFSAIPKGSVALTPVRNGSSLQRGDRLKMYFKPATPVFAYVIDQDPNGALALLFPGASGRPQATAGSEYFIPAGDDWFALDEQTGKEVFYLLVSSTRLQSLERALDAYAAARPADRGAAGKAVIDEMQALRRRFFEEQTTAEVPVDVGGTSRGLEDLVRQAVDVSAQNFYSRTIAIDHR